MKLAISNIAWNAQQDEQVYELMRKYNFTGLEIAPTRIFPELPYEKKEEAVSWSWELDRDYGFCVPSMQSIWYGRQEKLFGSEEERAILLAYTRKAIDFASWIGCHNLVFGCPKNRCVQEGREDKTGVNFFRKIGEYAAERGTVIGMEANPPIYNTNYINDTASALELIKEVDSKGFLLNLDVGTMIENKEDVSVLADNVKYINHVHISEPGLRPVEKREIHKKLYDVLKKEAYQGYISIEMGRLDSMELIENTMQYVRSVFGNE